MKRRTSLPAILAILGAFAALALPARADTLDCFYTMANPYEIQTGTDVSGNYFEYPFSVTRGDVAATKTVVATVADPTIAKLKNKNGSIAGTDSVSLSRETTRTDGEDTAEFTLVALKPGNTTVTVTISGDAAATATVTFAVVVTGVDTTTLITLSPMMMSVDEGTSTNRVTVTLGSAPDATKTLTLTLEGAGTPGDHVRLSPATTVTVPKGATTTSFQVIALDGDYNPFTVTVSDPAGDYQDAILQGAVNNVRPELRLPSLDPENPTPISALAGAPCEFTANADDKSADDRANLTYHWSISDSTSAVVTGRVSAAGQPVTVYATDNDGGMSDMGYYVVELADSSKIFFTDVCPGPLAVYGGNGPADFVINPWTTRTDDASQPWNENAGNDFYSPGGTAVQPIIPTNEFGQAVAYPFGWMFDSSLCSQQESLADLWIPNPSTAQIAIKAPEPGGRATVRYFSSYPYKNYWNELTGARIDNFGDFDQDGLSDWWESYYLNTEVPQNQRVFSNWENLAETDPTGKKGSSGTVFAGGTFYNTEDTPDNDRLPTARYEEIDNVWAGDPNVSTNEDAKFKVRAYLYPLTGNYVDYGTHVGEDVEFVTANGRVYGAMSDKRSSASKPFFSNIQEFRGLQQTSSEISIDLDKHPNWVSYGYPGILSRTNLYARGNCPGTDPTVADTDGDGREDGWEYYFWTTILYENDPHLWRAYDPTLALYPDLSPGGSADFSTAGFPLMRDETVQMTLVTNSVSVRIDEGGVIRIETVPIDEWDAYQAANPGLQPKRDYFYNTTPADGSPVVYDGGLYVRYPEEEFQVELVRNECYYGNPVLEPNATTRDEDSVNYLTNAPIASTPYYDADQDPEVDPPHAAVEFQIGGLLVYTREGYVDDRGRAKLFYTPDDDYYNDRNIGDFSIFHPVFPVNLEPGEIEGAYVDFRTGYFYLPGYDYFPPSAQQLIGDRNAVAKARYRTMNGLFPKAWLLNQFDPRSEDGGLMPNVADPDFNAILKPLGLSRAGWDPANDLDGDGLSDFEEYYLGTNPIHWDTDNDGLPDGWEVLFGLDPHDKTDASGNPDCDRMFATGYTDDRGVNHYYRHADAFLYDYFNEVYWNGQQSLGFVPGAASAASRVTDLPFTSREEFYMQKWMMGKAGRNLIFLDCIYPAQWLDGNGRCIYTTNPRNDDSNEDHIPDGWALYAGYIPVPGVDLIDHVFGPLHDFLPPICPDGMRNDPDGDGLEWRQEYDNWAMSETRQRQIESDPQVYVAEEQDSYHAASWYVPAATRWTNKSRPTSPWLGDTDGDGLGDASEYMEGDYDWNGDGDSLANFDPTTADTRFDRLPDSWHFYTGLYDTTNAAGAGLMGDYGPFGDPDGDGLPNYQEYLAGTVYAWRYDHWYNPDNKGIWQPDWALSGYEGLKTGDPGPYLQMYRAADQRIAEKFSEAPIVVGGGEARRSNPDWDPEEGPWDEEGNDPGLPIWEDAFPYGKSVHFQPYRPSDFLRARPSNQDVSAVVRTINVLENRWVNTLTNIPKVLTGFDANGNPQIGDGEPHVAGGWDERYSPTLHDLEKAYEDPTLYVSPIANYIQRAWALVNDRKLRIVPDVDPITGDYKSTAFVSVDEFYIMMGAINTLLDYEYSYGARPAPWEPAPASGTIQYVDVDIPVVWRFMTPNFGGAGGFPTLSPRNPDSDNDGMDDYWEVYHGLNPLYGGSPYVSKAGAYPDSDRADRHPYGNGSTRDWIMNGDITYVRVNTMTEIGPQPITREDAAFHTPLTGMPIAEAAHFDYNLRPWLSGDRFADPDQDGLSNQEESYNYLLNDVLHHTDPSPYWFTDPSYAESYANLYYKVDGEMASIYWWWDENILGTIADGPTYLFDFEIGEGFDTDNDNISDREELTQSDNSGVTDPQNFDSPRNRKALYFDGHAAARTRNPYYHDKFTLTSYTVEFWVRPEELPAPGKRQTLVQRPVFMPVDDSSGASHWQIRHTFLIQIDELGKIHARVDNDAIETVSSATVVSAGRLVPGHWAHVALVMDSVADRFTLYVNGEYAAGVGAGLKPCTGGLFGFQWLSPTGTQGTWENANLYDYSPAPIVLGAYDRNPWGVVAGPYETNPWAIPSVAGQSQPDFDPDQYFTGWMDEVRIWDRCRSQSEIKNWMTKRATAADIWEINHARLAWELEGWEPDRVGDNLVAATASSDFPQKLLYHYTFDNLPDTVANDRDTSFADYFGQDAYPYPAGWKSDVVSGYRPTPFWSAPWWYPYADTILPHLVPWWYTATHRSNVYNDYSYVPWIENTVAHLPQTPALDMKGLFPNWDEYDWTVTSYRYRSSLDWQNDAMIASTFVPYRRDDVVPAALPATGSADVQLSQIKNTMNPYVMFYRTAVSIADETDPKAFAGKLDTYGRYTGIPVLSDMLPLMDAVADIDVEMWDGRGRGTALEGVDTDGDGLPDWWEIAHGLDYTSGEGEDGAYGDSDGDGLDNWAEYLAHTDPFRYDTDGDGYSDYYSRPDGKSLTYGELYDDGDGMDNVWESSHGLDPNRYDATGDIDGDGWTNWEEYMAGTDPQNKVSFPTPTLSITFDYDGVVSNTENLVVYSYGERTVGPNMGGAYDGKFTEVPNWSFGTRLLGDDGKAKSAGGYVRNVSFFPLGHVAQATMTIQTEVNGTNTLMTLPLQHWNEEYGMFISDISGAIGLVYESGTVFCSDSYVGTPFQLNITIDGYTFPFTDDNMLRTANTHVVGGNNRFLGFIDMNYNKEYDIGEPMGISIPRPTLVSWDSASTEIPMTDELWDYPRISWPSVGISPNLVYYVDFTWVRGASTRTDTETVGGGNAYYGTTGDLDNDGLEDWMEVLAGTATNSPAGSPNDYYSIDPATGFSYGEVYDDGDGMPTSWEMKYHLDPYRYDASGDVDDDGWSNYAEFMAGTDPTSASDYPHPRLAATFYYHGQETDLYCLGVYSYGQKTQGATWGGSYDGRYTSTKGFSDGVYLGSDGSITLDKYSDAGAQGTFAVNKLRHGLIESASIDVYVTGDDGAVEVRSFQMTQINPGMGLFTQDDMGWILISIESGQVLSSGDYVGKLADVHTTVKTYSFPVTFTSLIRNPEGNHTHMVEGPNRFLGWMDLDGNETYDQGEPMGLTLYNPTLVGWDSTSIEIPLTDSLWDYPRVSWNDFAPTNFVPTDYIVRFVMKGKTTSGAIITNETSTTTTVGIYGDLDGDGLDAWAEAKAGTDLNKPDTDGDGRLDYDEADTAGVLDANKQATFGELLDDWDGMPAQWELGYGLDPHLFDADMDPDGDGWSNYAEYMANTDPSDPDDYPEPQFDVTFRYDGEANGASTLKVLSYSEARQGTYLDGDASSRIYMGGLYDGLYTTQAKGFGNFADLGRGEIDGKDFGTSSFGGERVGSASLTVNYKAEGAASATKVTYQLQPYNDAFGVFIDDGEAFILLEYATGLIYSQFNYEVSRGRTEQNADGTVTTISEKVQETSYDTSPHYQSRYTIEYSSSTTHYPFTIRGLQAANAAEDTGAYAAHDHMVEGYNRFLGWMDLDNDNTWTPGEPMGLSVYNKTLVGWDSVVAEIPLTDELFGFPRIAWPASTNADVTSYAVYIWNNAGDLVVPDGGIRVEAPRTFVHEGDYLQAGIRGIDFGTASSDAFDWTVVADNRLEEEVVASGTFTMSTLPNAGSRRTPSAIYPVDGDVLHGPLVEFLWNMDWRTEGVFFTLKKDGTAVGGLNNLYIPFPVRHGKVTDDDYHYGYVPQLENGESIVSLGAGNYTWEVKENLQLSGYTAKTATGSFKIANGTSTTRSVASISGNVHYYGRLASAAGVFTAGKVVILAYKVSDRATSSLDVSGQPVAKLTCNGAGAFTVPNLEPGAYGLIGFVDANGNGLPDVGETQGLAFTGGSADPIQVPEWFKPIRIKVVDGAAVSVQDVHIVLRDRDLNGDGVPELFTGTLAQYRAKALVTVPASKPTSGPGTNWVSTCIFDPLFKPYSSRTTKKTDISGGGSTTTGEAEWQFAVRAPRTFLHEGDLARLKTWGFDLGAANAADFTWEVVATDGYHSETNSGGSFSVFAGTAATRMALKARWPVQNTVVHGSTVKFEWEMDEHNAGVLFTLKDAAGNVLIDNATIAFPVLHWDSTVNCYYYTAVPQMEDGLRFVDLPDGEYTYTITERPNTTAVTPQTVTERFQVRNAVNTRVTGSIEGTVWYYGRSGTDDLHVQAYLTSDAATSSASVGGLLVEDRVFEANDAFRLEGLKAGTYSVFAFVDANGNGVADEWETQGFGFYGGNASPVVIPSAAVPIVVTNGASVVGVNVVLHDRDTDGDLLPDGWEYATYGKLSTQSGYDAAASNAYVSLPAPDASILTNWIWKIDTSTVVTRTVDIPQTDGLRVRVDNPRDFLHEGDFMTPYVLKDVSPGAVDTPANRRTYLWSYSEVDGVRTWVPRTTPYYGFYLGSYSNVVVNWTASVWDGSASYEITNGAFKVTSRVGEARSPLSVRYPKQLAKVYGNVVEFEWGMDWHNAGVLFSLDRIGEDGSRTAVFDKLVIPFPVRHGQLSDASHYYTAIPQMEDGERFVALEEGVYEYTITERPQTDLVGEPQSVTERFQLVNSGTNRAVYVVSGGIRYYGRLMEIDEDAFAGVEFSANDARTVWTAQADPSAFARGSMSVLVVDGDDAVEAFNDSAANGILYVTGGTDATAWSGTIDYDTGDIVLRFSKPLAAGRTVKLAKKTFPAPLYVQAFKLPDDAATAVSIAGNPVAQIVSESKGPFAISNLSAGTYAIRAFVDSNGNRKADDWETQGVAVLTDTVSPNVDPEAAPIIVKDDVTGLMIVLHDRDTDNDLLPDSWEWWKTGGSLSTSGYDVSDAGGLLWWQEYADGILDSDPRTPDTDLDGLTDAMEILVTGTDTHMKDTDGDGVGDLEEFLSGSDPLVADDAKPYTVPALAFDENGVPFVDLAYPALKPGVVLSYELQRKLSLADGEEAWETVASHDVASTDDVVFYGRYDGVNGRMSEPGTARMLPADQAEGVDFTAGFYRVKIYADYGKMVDNGDGTWSYWTWVETDANTFAFREAARGEGTLVRTANGDWAFVDPETKKASGSLVRNADGSWTFVK